MKKNDIQPGVLFFGFSEAGNHNDGNARADFPHLPHEHSSAIPGKNVIRDNHPDLPGGVGMQKCERLLGTLRQYHIKARLAQNGRSHLQLGWTVVNKQNLEHGVDAARFQVITAVCNAG